MKTVYTPEDISLMDAEEIKRGTDVFDLVELAGAKIAETIQQCHSGGKALFFCGTGNNGADGMAAARLMRGAYSCRIVVLGGAEKLSPSTLRHHEMAERAGAEVFHATTEKGLDHALTSFEPDIVIDAMLGTGANRFPTGLMEAAIAHISSLSATAEVVAIDVPTGVMPTNGRVGKSCVNADITITIQGIKPGLLMYPGAEYAGEIIMVQAFEPSYKPPTERFLFEDSDVQSMARQRHSHKGSFGRLGIIAGSRGLSGAGAMCARAALRSGCGMLTIASPSGTAQIYAGMICEAMTCYLDEKDGGYGDCCEAVTDFIADKNACVIGPGMGKGDGVYPVVVAALQSDKPLVLDADALNALAANGMEPLKNRGNTIVTPHPAELARLMKTDIDIILGDPLGSAESFANDYGCICVLKMSTTVVAARGRTAIVTSGCAAMAKGGSGDVLAGCMGSMLASGKEPFYSACLAAYVCGKAGEAAQKRLGSTYSLPTDEIESLSTVFMKYE